MRSTEGYYLDRVDHMRAWAAILVFMFHVVGDYGGAAHFGGRAPNLLTVWIIEGHTGVSMFIMLSGFILTVVNRDVLLAGAGISYRGFILNRFLRIFPLLAFVTAIAIAYRYPDFSSLEILPLLTLQMYANDSIGLSNEWAVGVEFQCYLVFPLLLYAMRDKGLRYILLLVAFFVTIRYTMAAAEMVGHNGRFYHVLMGRLDQFAVGMGAALIFLRVRSMKLPVWAAPAAIVIGLVCVGSLLIYGNSIGGGTARYGEGWFYAATFHVTEAALWALVLLGYLLLPIKAPGSSVWAKIGESSYSLYLLHGIVLTAIQKTLYSGTIYPLLGPLLGNFYSAVVAAIFVVLPVTFLIAWMSYNVVERPALAFRRRYIGLEETHAAP